MTATAESVTTTRSDEQIVSDLIDRLLAEHPPSATPEKEFLGAQFDAGLAWIHFPPGARAASDLSPQASAGSSTRRLSARPAHRSAARPVNPIGHGMAAPTVDDPWKRETRSSRYLRPLFTGEAGLVPACSASPGAGSAMWPVCRRSAVK